MTDTPEPAAGSPLLEAVLNLSRVHREHEKFYASSPREIAVRLQRHARTLQALADRWTEVEPATRSSLSPFEGADDLNADAALQLGGVLFMEGQGAPPELSQLVSDLRGTAGDFAATGEWLADAMLASWDAAAALLAIDELADLLGERHRIIANDWHAAHMQTLIATILARAADLLDTVDFTPAALRADLAGERVSAARLHSAAEMIGHAADLASDSAGLVHDNERRWRVFHTRVEDIVGHRG